jgi:hypothetical protein
VTTSRVRATNEDWFENRRTPYRKQTVVVAIVVIVVFAIGNAFLGDTASLCDSVLEVERSS